MKARIQAKDFALGATAIVMVILAHAAPAAALSVTNIMSIGASTSAAHANVNASAQASSTANSSSGLGARVSNIAHAIVGSSTVGGASTTAHGSGGVGVGQTLRAAILPIVLTRAEVASQGSAGGSAAANGNALASPTSIRSDDELSTFIAAKIAHDPHLEEVQAASGTVAVKYDVPARFLGFIPVTMEATTAVGSDGTVTVQLPWWSFLATLSVDLKQAVQAQVNAILGTNTSADVTATTTTGTTMAQAHAQANAHAAVQVQMNAQLRAELIDAITAALQAAVNAQTSGSVQVQ